MQFKHANRLMWQNFSELKKELEQQGRKYAQEAISFRDKIAELALGFIKDDAVVSALSSVACADAYRPIRADPHALVLTRGFESFAPRSQDETDFRICHRVAASRTRVSMKKFFPGRFDMLT